MKSHLKVLGHPLHAILVFVPLGLLIASVLFDARYLFTKKQDNAVTSDKLVGVGVVTGLLAAAAGLVDWLAIPQGTRAKRIGFWHGTGNVIMLALYASSWKLRRDEPQNPPRKAIVLSLLGLLLGNVTAWMGSEMVYRLGIGVDEKAHPDAPNSIIHT
jgi:uncharacterized membrane protein